MTLHPGSPAALKIQIVSTYYAPESTGNAPYSTSLAEGLADLGHEVTVLAAAPHYPGWVILPHSTWSSDERMNGVHVRRVASYVPPRPNSLKRLVYEIGFGVKFAVRCSREADVVLLVSPSLFSSVIVRSRLRLGRRPPAVVLWMQDLYSAGVKETQSRTAGMFTVTVQAVEGRLARSCSAVVVIHQRFLSALTKDLKVPNDRIEIIRNWTHVSPALEIDAPTVRQRLGWQVQDEIVVVHAGNMGVKQGLENVVDAARWSETHNLPVHFLLLGDGNQRALLQARGKGCSRLHFLAPLPENEFLDVLAAADVLLVNERPSLSVAAVPSKLTTYFATGRPVLAATDSHSATADEIRASGAGRIVPPASPEELVHAAIAVSREWTVQEAEAGPSYVRRVLSREAGISAFDALLRSVTATAVDDSRTHVGGTACRVKR